jgi:dimeric dUTPase (all-alpha-NTP-PPase superfamily)
MIRLHSDYLVFELESGESVPCSVEAIASELVEAVSGLTDRNIIENAARAVVHYFREEQKQEVVNIREFIDCLAFVLKGFGFEVETNDIACDLPSHGNESISDRFRTTHLVDILEILRDQGALMEMHFFQKLRTLLNDHLSSSAEIIQFTGVRPCVQQLLACGRWTKRCEAFRQQIVLFLEECLLTDGCGHCNRMVIR